MRTSAQAKSRPPSERLAGRPARSGSGPATSLGAQRPRSRSFWPRWGSFASRSETAWSPRAGPSAFDSAPDAASDALGPARGDHAVSDLCLNSPGDRHSLAARSVAALERASRWARSEPRWAPSDIAARAARSARSESPAQRARRPRSRCSAWPPPVRPHSHRMANPTQQAARHLRPLSPCSSSRRESSSS